MRAVLPVRRRLRAPGQRPWLRRRTRVALAGAVAALACILLLPAASAFGATGHKLVSTLTEAPAGTPLGAPEALAVDQKGDVFVADKTRGLIDEYGSSGELKTQFGAGVLPAGVSLPGIAVDEASGDVYVIEEPSVVRVFKPNGTGGYELLSSWEGAHAPLGLGFGELAGVAVDSSTGKVYLADPGNGTVDVFQSNEGKEGEFVGFVTGKPEFEEPVAVAVNSATGQVYVGDRALGEEAGVVEVLIPSKTKIGAFELEHKISGKSTPAKGFGELAGVAFDPTTQDVYVAERVGKAVDQFNKAGEWTGWLTGTEPGRLFGEPVRAVRHGAQRNDGQTPGAKQVRTRPRANVHGGTQGLDQPGRQTGGIPLRIRRRRSVWRNRDLQRADDYSIRGLGLGQSSGERGSERPPAGNGLCLPDHRHERKWRKPRRDRAGPRNAPGGHRAEHRRANEHSATERNARRLA
jgi:hypothetical protein